MIELHFELTASTRHVIEVRLDRAANVRLFDPENHARFARGASFRCDGGAVRVSPYDLVVPADGTYHVVIDCGGERVPGVEIALRSRRRRLGRRRSIEPARPERPGQLARPILVPCG